MNTGDNGKQNKDADYERRREFGCLVKALREQHGKYPHVKDLASRIGLSEYQLYDIEGGRRANLSIGELQDLAQAFSLIAAERRAFFLAYLSIHDPELISAEIDEKALLQRLTYQMEEIRVPFFLNDSYGDIVAANTAIIKLLQVPIKMMEPANIRRPAGVNVMRLVFGPRQEYDFQAFVGDTGWADYEIHNMAYFRAQTLRYRHTTAYSMLWNEMKHWDRFDAAWSRCSTRPDIDSVDGSMRYRYNHREYGWLRYYTSLGVWPTRHGTLRLNLYNAASEHTAEVFRELMSDSKLVWLLDNWPSKPWVKDE